MLQQCKRRWPPGQLNNAQRKRTTDGVLHSDAARRLRRMMMPKGCSRHIHLRCRETIPWSTSMRPTAELRSFWQFQGLHILVPRRLFEVRHHRAGRFQLAQVLRLAPQGRRHVARRLHERHQVAIDRRSHRFAGSTKVQRRRWHRPDCPYMRSERSCSCAQRRISIPRS